MKKLIVTVAIAGFIAALGINSANARYGSGPANCAQYGAAGQIDPATQKKYDAFYESTRELRKELAAKRAQQRAIMRAQSPDPEGAAKLAEELFDLREKFQAKAVEAGLSGAYGRGCAGAGIQGRGGCSGHGDCFKGGQGRRQ
jgi:Spy/CpxP family protein refolding chaperone